MDQAIAELEARLSTFGEERYPMQHATAQFHLGVALTNAGRVGEAETALRTAARLFDPGALPAEHAKSLNALGAALRLAGRPDEATGAFVAAAALFGREALTLEQGAALFNLGLVQRETGRDPVPALLRARDLLDPVRAPAQAAAAARELGAALLTAGRNDEATVELRRSVELADRSGSAAELGAALNTLGLALLAAGGASEAAEAFKQAAGAHPRSVRPADYAMTKLNLAIACEAVGAAARARLAALQALGTPSAPQPVVIQARELLARLPDDETAVFAVLAHEPEEAWPALVREELMRWSDASPEEQVRSSGAWIDGQVGHPAGDELAAAWVGALVELPPDAMRALVESSIRAAGGRPAASSETFRAQLERGMSRLHTPQLLRLRETFEQAGRE